MKDLKNKVRIELVSKYGILKPIRIVIPDSKFEILKDILLNSDDTLSDIVELELFAYRRLGRIDYFTNRFVFSKSQCVRIKRHEVSGDFYNSFNVL